MAPTLVPHPERTFFQAVLLLAAFLFAGANPVFSQTASPTVEPPGIPVEAKVFQNHHYLRVEEKVTGVKAKLACTKMGGHLVSITSPEENEFVSSLTDGKAVWIGGFHYSGGWKWINGEEISNTSDGSFVQPVETIQTHQKGANDEKPYNDHPTGNVPWRTPPNTSGFHGPARRRAPVWKSPDQRPAVPCSVPLRDGFLK